MLPDLTTPDTCPTCSAAKSHDVRKLDTLALLGRVYKCGAALSTNAAGGWFTAIVCRRAGEVIDALRAENARLRADNVRIGDRNVLLATELQAIADAAEEQLDDWLPVVIEQLPGYLHFAREVLDLATEALEGEPRPSAAVGVAPGEPAKAGQGLSVTAASAHSGGVS